ncbi:hypothetical protein N657DRAFT_648911 [Parathielavia appendiculata]|uniref:Uncharacterized protein n=1 Tax=Parathielavia appendiculata TaxID=2587402 RepID=A0AAN6Z076_9PEZI|nr:hypothetical protein N657DRAFT_648911 [Parathielavia appendiculata]
MRGTPPPAFVCSAIEFLAEADVLASNVRGRASKAQIQLDQRGKDEDVIAWREATSQRIRKASAKSTSYTVRKSCPILFIQDQGKACRSQVPDAKNNAHCAAARSVNAYTTGSRVSQKHRTRLLAGKCSSIDDGLTSR